MNHQHEDYIENEKKRIEIMKQYENQAFQEGFQLIAGLDEVGRGCIAGPVVSAAVILPHGFFLPGVDDSKKLTPAKRQALVEDIKQQSVAWAVAWLFPPLLDRINILNATREAMKLAVRQLCPQPDLLLIDALTLKEMPISQLAIVKGDSLSVSIACASILAKVERDRTMEALDSLYPGYGFAKHKGYATREHLQSLHRLGAAAIHRSSFEPVKSMLAGGPHPQPSLFEQEI